MTIAGKEIQRLHDEEGEVRVYDSAELRILSFDGKVEQSCVAKSRPWRLHYAYTQAMMLGVLWHPDPQSVFVLGLGGGSLVRCLHHFYPDCRIQSVESRAVVLDVAREFFYLPLGAGLDYAVNRAEQWLLEQADARADIIFTDLFDCQGMESVQMDREYLTQCRDHLSDEGLLVLNMWDDGRGQRLRILKLLNELFDGRPLPLPVMGGNLIILVHKHARPVPGRRAFMEQAEALGRLWGVPLARFARGMWSENGLDNRTKL